MAVGGATWQTASLIESGQSPPTLANDKDPDGQPTYGAWWKIVAPASGVDGVIIDTFESFTDAEGTDAFLDTIIEVYRETDLAIEPDTNLTPVYARNDDFGPANRSRVDFPVSPGETYYVGVGMYGPPSEATYYVATVQPYRYTDWAQGPDENRTVATLVGTVTLESLPSRTATTPDRDPSNAYLQQAASQSYNSPTITAFDAGVGDNPSFGNGMTLSGDNLTANKNFRYRTDSNGRRSTAGTLQFADGGGFDIPPPESGWPSGAVGAEYETSVGEILASRVDYVFTEVSSDSSAGGASDAGGSWTYRLQTDTDSVSFGGPMSNGFSSSGTLLAPVDYLDDWPVASVALYLDFGSVSALDPSFRYTETDQVHGGGLVNIGDSWELSTTVVVRPPRLRYKMLTAASTAVAYDPPYLRNVQRGDGLGFSSAPRAIQNNSVQGSLRNFGFN